MGRIGLTEIVIIAVLAFIFIQPKDLFHFVRRMGKAWQQMKSMRDEFVQGLRDVEAEVTKGFSGPGDARTAPRDPEGQGQEPRG
jgi:Sec-independent protein translocase protein TatA